jgi:hypothetical protein
MFQTSIDGLGNNQRATKVPVHAWTVPSRGTGLPNICEANSHEVEGHDGQGANGAGPASFLMERSRLDPDERECLMEFNAVSCKTDVQTVT